MESWTRPQRRWRSTKDGSHLYKLGVRARGYNRARLAIDKLPYGRCCEGEGSAHLASPAFNLDGVAIFCPALV